MSRLMPIVLAVLLSAQASPQALAADFTVSAPAFGEHMVLQSGMRVPVWGTATAKTKVTVEFAGQRPQATAAADGRWLLALERLAPCKQPRTLRVSSGKAVLQYGDVLVGEVWICAGQSNMEFPLAREKHAHDELPQSARPRLRLLNMEYAGQGIAAKPFPPSVARRLVPERFYQGRWQVSGPATTAGFSAVGYYFGKRLEETLDVPVGLVNLSVGGSPTESWIRREALAADAPLKPLVTGNWLQNASLGAWCRQRGRENLAPPLADVPADDLGPNHAFKPSFLWQAGIARIVPMAIRGVVWYQGESNSLEACRVPQHERLFPLLVCDWRKEWRQGDFPFYFCQLSAIEADRYDSQCWPEFRDSQRRMALELTNVGMAVTSDLGDRRDVHPREKREVGRRLALLALARTYHKDIVCEGPAPIEVESRGAALSVRFARAGAALTTADGKPLRGFQIAARQSDFHAADARIDGPQVHLTSRAVAHPSRVRYAWQPFPNANLINAEGLPASTFAADIPETK